MVNLTLFKGFFFPSQVVQDFFQQQCFGWNLVTCYQSVLWFRIPATETIELELSFQKVLSCPVFFGGEPGGLVTVAQPGEESGSWWLDSQGSSWTISFPGSGKEVRSWFGVELRFLIELVVHILIHTCKYDYIYIFLDMSTCFSFTQQARSWLLVGIPPNRIPFLQLASPKQS